MKRIREFFKSIAFAGMKPGGQAPRKPQLMWLGPLRAPFERLLSGGPAPTDPLYLTNRTLARKLISWSLVAIPCALLAVGIGVTLSKLLDPPQTTPPKAPVAAEPASKVLPDLGKDTLLVPPSDVEVLELKLDGSRLVGVVKNTGTREIAVVELIIALTTTGGAQVGGAKAIVEKLPPSGRKGFQIPIKRNGAESVLVKEVTTR